MFQSLDLAWGKESLGEENPGNHTEGSSLKDCLLNTLGAELNYIVLLEELLKNPSLVPFSMPLLSEELKTTFREECQATSGDIFSDGLIDSPKKGCFPPLENGTNVQKDEEFLYASAAEVEGRLASEYQQLPVLAATGTFGKGHSIDVDKGKADNVKLEITANETNPDITEFEAIDETCSNQMVEPSHEHLVVQEWTALYEEPIEDNSDGMNTFVEEVKESYRQGRKMRRERKGGRPKRFLITSLWCHHLRLLALKGYLRVN